MEQYEKEHMETLRALAPECMVLLKQDGEFPLDAPCQIAAFGNGVRHTVAGSSRSAGVRRAASIEASLQSAGFEITSGKWLDAYDRVRESAEDAFHACQRARIEEGGMRSIHDTVSMVMKEPEYDLPLDGEGDTAVYVLSRSSGESMDRTDTKGDFRLTDTETRDILALCDRFARFMLVLNVCGPVDLTEVADRVPNILLLSQLGSVTGDALVDVLLGRSYPSGKLAASWAAFADYPDVGDFGESDDTHYREGVYVGYRWFDAARKEPLFPFGYGLSCTHFDIQFVETRIYGSMARVIIRELDGYKKEFARPRRTKLEDAEEIVLEEKPQEVIPVVLLADRFGYVRTIEEAVYEKNKAAADTENRFVLHCTNADTVCVFTDSGRMHLLKVKDVPHGKFRDKGTPMDNICNYNSGEETFIAMFGQNEIKDTALTFVTETGMMKRVEGAEFDVGKRTTAATKLAEGDKVVEIHAASEDAHIVLNSANGFFLRFPLSEIPFKKKNAVGVRGMKLGTGDRIRSVYWLEGDLVPDVVWNDKPVAVNKLKIGSRDTKGTKR